MSFDIFRRYANRNKIVNKYAFNRMWLDIMTNKIMWLGQVI